jgi:hypothetical protein
MKDEGSQRVDPFIPCVETVYYIYIEDILYSVSLSSPYQDCRRANFSIRLSAYVSFRDKKIKSKFHPISTIHSSIPSLL